MKKKISNKKEDKIFREIENLALITGKGFDRVQKQFEGVHKKLDEHDKNFDEVDGQLKVVVNELMRLGDEVKDVKGATMDLVHMSADQDKENRKIVFRLDHLENRAAAR